MFKRARNSEDPQGFIQRESALSIAQKRLLVAGRTMNLLHEREKFRLAFHRANEDYQAHYAGLSPAAKEQARLLEQHLELGLATPTPVPAEVERVPTRPTTVVIEGTEKEKKEEKEEKKKKEKTKIQILKGRENRLKAKLKEEKKREKPEEERIWSLEDELRMLKEEREELRKEALSKEKTSQEQSTS